MIKNILKNQQEELKKLLENYRTVLYLMNLCIKNCIKYLHLLTMIMMKLFIFLIETVTKLSILIQKNISIFQSIR